MKKSLKPKVQSKYPVPELFYNYLTINLLRLGPDSYQQDVVDNISSKRFNIDFPYENSYIFAIINPKTITMKKILLIAAVVGFAMTSCKKDRTCNCTQTYTDSGGTTTTTSGITTTLKKISKSDAKSLCEKTTTVDVDNAGKTTTLVYDCSLK